MKPFVILAFYQFVPLSDFENMKEPVLKAMRALNIRGTIILASEGINGSFCGGREAVDALVAHLRNYAGLQELVFRETFHDENPFGKAKVKLRREIVTMGADGILPHKITGVHLNPEEWNQLLDEPNVVLIDTRNEYEIMLGRFDGAISPQTDNFRDFPEYVEKHLMDKKDKKIAMYCTGGIRCEKSTSYLKAMGFDQVYQLHGGILNYMEKMNDSDSKWQGSCFVFDDRVALDSNLNSLPKGSIDGDWKNNNKKHRKSSA